MLFLRVIWIASSGPIHVFLEWIIKAMDSGWWEQGFSYLECEVIDEVREEARVIHMVMDLRLKYQYELMFSLIRIQFPCF